MSEFITISTTSLDLEKKLAGLKNTRQMISAQRRGVGKALLYLRDEARRNLLSSYPKAKKKNPKYRDTLWGMVRKTKNYLNTDKTVSGKVLIAGLKASAGKSYTTRKGKSLNISRSYQLPWIEGGTDARATRKGWNRGSQRPLSFFARAVAANLDKLPEIMIKEIGEEIDKIISKNNG